MSNSGTTINSELIKVFEFLNSETPETKVWVNRYLTAHGIPAQVNIASTLPLKVELARAFGNLGMLIDSLKVFAKKMGNAWRVKKHRDKKDVVSLSVSLDKTVAIQLSQMSKCYKKAEIITKLIQDNYQEFLAKEDERKAKLAEERRIRRLERDNSKSQKQLKQLCNNSSYESDQSRALAELRDDINHLIKMVDVMAQQNKKNDEGSLSQKAETTTESGQMHKPHDAILTCQPTLENLEVLEAIEEIQITSIQSSEGQHVPELTGLEQKLEPDIKSTYSDSTTIPIESVSDESAASGVSDAALDVGNTIITSARGTADTTTIEEQPNAQLNFDDDNIPPEPKESQFVETRIVDSQPSEPNVLIDSIYGHVTTGSTTVEAQIAMKLQALDSNISTGPKKSSFRGTALAKPDTQLGIEWPAGSETMDKRINVAAPEIQQHLATPKENNAYSYHPDPYYNTHRTRRFKSTKSNS